MTLSSQDMQTALEERPVKGTTVMVCAPGAVHNAGDNHDFELQYLIQLRVDARRLIGVESLQCRSREVYPME